MTKQAGRKVLLKKNDVTIAGLRTKSLTVNGSPIDVSDEGSSGYMEYLDDTLVDRSLELTGEGIEEDGVIKGIAFGTEAEHFLDDITLVYEDGGVISGDFVLTTYGEGMDYKDAVTFNFTLISSAAFALSAAS